MIMIVPMAGRGARFADRGFETPKPLISICGQPMVYWALKTLETIPCGRVIFVALAEHEAKYQLSKRLRACTQSPTTFVFLDQVTEGQLCTVLAAARYLDTDEDVLIASSDTAVVSDLARDISNRARDCHGIISVADMPGDRWSFALTDDSGRVIRVAEKVRISDLASTGLYYFSSGRELVGLGRELIAAGERTRGEYYVIPVYQKLIGRGGRVEVSRATEMWDMGTPEAKAAFEAHLEQHDKRPPWC
jgi:NDP-sugar pyrophosphorylase family protein